MRKLVKGLLVGRALHGGFQSRIAEARGRGYDVDVRVYELTLRIKHP